MTQTQAQRYTAAMNGVLGRIKLGDKCSAEVTGPQPIMVRSPQGQTFDMGYQAMVVLAHNRLLNTDPVAVTVGIRGLLPPVAAFEQAATPLLEQCRQMRDRANNPEPGPIESAAVDADALQNKAAAFSREMEKIGTEPKPEPTAKAKPRERESHFS